MKDKELDMEVEVVTPSPEVKVEEPTGNVEEPAQEEDIIVYEYADFHLKCHACGHDTIIIPNVKGALRTDLYTTNKHNLRLSCEKCGVSMEYYYTESTNPPKEEQPSEDSKQQDESVPVPTTEAEKKTDK